MKGDFKWAKDVRPVYLWFNGTADRYLIGDKMDPAGVTPLNAARGSRDDKSAKITPFKLMGGRQPYDAVNNTFIVPHLFGGYWKHWNWDEAFATGMKAAGQPYSGKYGWAETSMVWKVNHMVVPKSQALGCNDCHSSTGRLDWKALGYRGDPRGLARKTR